MVKKQAKTAKAKPPKKAKSAAVPTAEDGRYTRHRDQKADSFRRASAKGREIGGIPDIEDIKRRERCRDSLRKFCETYNPAPFYFAWSADHLRMIARIEETARDGGLFAFAMPRGSGKTAICRMAALWLLSYGYRRYPFIIGATDSKAREMLDTLRVLIRFRPEYAADFPEISWPARCLAGIANRASGQTCGGESTLIEWASDKIVLATVPPPSNWPKRWRLREDGMVPTSGALVSSSGLSGEGIRGSLKTLMTGAMVRPDFVLLDDPQTKESAKSLAQNRLRLELVSGDVLGMAGPGKKMAAVMPCTVIEPGDMVDTVLDRSKHPLWRGERTAMLTTMPKNMAAWDPYFEEFYRCAQKEPSDYTESNAYFEKHQRELEEGAVASWPERKEPNELSAIQSAMHLYARDRRAFYAEYQNQPLGDESSEVTKELDATTLAKRLTRVPRGIVPRECTRLTAFIDCGNFLWYSVVAWTERWGGGVVEYGSWPRQNRDYWTKRDTRKLLTDHYPGKSEEQALYAGIIDLAADLIGRDWRREGGEVVRIERCLVDEGWNDRVAYQACRESRYSAVLLPAKGWAGSLAKKGMNEWATRAGERAGQGWRLGPVSTGKGVHVLSDTYFWKTFLADRLTTDPGVGGDLKFFGDDFNAHRLIADHCTAEFAIRETEKGGTRSMISWDTRPNRDNDLWDCLVGCAVAASIQGLQWSASGVPVAAQEGRRKISFAEQQRQTLNRKPEGYS